MTKGLCSQIAERVKYDNADKAVINADELLGIIYNSVDLSQVPTAEKDRFILGFLLRIILNQLGYRSVIRQKKVYVNPELMDPKELDVLLDNTNFDISNLEKIRNTPVVPVVDNEKEEFIRNQQHKLAKKSRTRRTTTSAAK